LFMKGARIMEFDKLREVIGDYQQLDFAKGAIELPLHCAEALDADGLGKEYWHTVPDPPKPSDGHGHSNSPPDDPRRPAWERRVQCYDLVLDSLETFENKVASGDDATERVRAHAYELAFLSTDEIFHSRLYEWLISRGLADELLEVRKDQPSACLDWDLIVAQMRPSYLQAYLKREPRTLDKYQLLWQFYVKDGQPLRAAEVLAAFAESSECVLSQAPVVIFLNPFKILFISISTDRVLDPCRWQRKVSSCVCGWQT
jgi:nuclear pore complex protein Nup155